jgi:hypothetical protein
MKQVIRYSIFVWVFLLILPGHVFSQKDTLSNSRKLTNIVSIEEEPHRTRVKFPGGDVEVDEMNDTITRITLGRRRYEVIDKPGHHTRIQTVREPRTDFKGHWAGFDLGLTNFFSTPFDSELPSDGRWMDLNSGKSVSVGMNLVQYSIGLQKVKDNFGIVTGLGWTINNYRFDSRNIMIRNDDGITTYRVAERNVEKNKLVTSYLTIPVLLEFQLPARTGDKDFFISAGVYGGFRLGTHTKVVYSENGDREKEKGRDDYNVNAFKYGLMAKLGYKWINLYARCDMTPLLESGRGPEVYPWTVGVTLIHF